LKTGHSQSVFSSQPLFFQFNKVAVSAFICKLHRTVATNVPMRVVVGKEALAQVLFSLLV